MLRNPKDEAVSWYKFRLNLPFYSQGRMLELHSADWSEFLEQHYTGSSIYQ